MPKNAISVVKPGPDDDAIEPEIVGGPSHRAYHAEREAKGIKAGFQSFIFRLKLLIAAVMGIIALTLIIAGAVLTSTVIGAILGIPLMLAGALLIMLLVKVFTGGKNFVVFHNGRHR